MSKIELFQSTNTEDIGSIVRSFATQGRALITAARLHGTSGEGLKEWYLDFCADADNRFGSALYMYAKGNPEISRDFVFGKNIWGDREKLYGPRSWKSGPLLYGIMQMREGSRRGQIMGAELNVDHPSIAETLGIVRFIDNPSSELRVNWFRNPYASFVINSEGMHEYGYGLDIVSALSKAVSVVETMPGITPPISSSHSLGAIEAVYRELPPA